MQILPISNISLNPKINNEKSKPQEKTPPNIPATQSNVNFLTDMNYGVLLVNKKTTAPSFKGGVSSLVPQIVGKIPLEENALEHYWLVQTGIKKEDLNDTKSDSISFMVSRNWAPYEGWQRDIHLRWSYDSFDQGRTGDNTMLIYPGVSFSKTTKMPSRKRWRK